MKEYYAHSLPGRPEKEWQQLENHLQEVAGKAREFGAVFGAGDWAELGGLWHDVGKYRETFQRYLKDQLRPGDNKEHAIVGALLAGRVSQSAWPLQFIISGHHTGLQNREDVTARIARGRTLLDEAFPQASRIAIASELPPLPAYLSPVANESRHAAACRQEFWVRMLFSCLVDADFLDTERFMKGIQRPTFPTIAALADRLDNYIDAYVARLPPAARDNPVNVQRKDILAACRNAATLEPGIFSLTVPTGGGKTLSAMSFALRHAAQHGMNRVIVVAPFTSIIEQNTDRYRDALGTENVIEHHASLTPDKDTMRNKLAGENWDAPVIVTTAVQFFESLLANRTSRCRKLHNIARSVVILDEAQSLPPDFLYPILDVLRQLTAPPYRASLVISTATQPALHRRKGLLEGFEPVREIMPDPDSLARNLNRVVVEWPDANASAISYLDLAQQLQRDDHSRVLAIVHRRHDARELANLLPAEGRYHLSGLMCAAHRRHVLQQVHEALRDPARHCRLVATQLVEAGVDVDFPLVYRAMAGLDSIAQAAGRCNREGKLDQGRVIVFVAPTDPPPGTPKIGLETTQAMLREIDFDYMPKDVSGGLDITNPEVFGIFFRRFYGKKNLDALGIQAMRADFQFEDVGRAVQLIDSSGARPLVVPYGDASALLGRLAWPSGMNRENLRALQPYTVTLYPRDWDLLNRAGAIETIEDTVHALAEPFKDRYDEEFGLIVDEDMHPNPANLIVQ